MGKFTLGNKEITYAIKEGKNSKYVYLNFKPNSELEIVLPPGQKIKAEDVLKKNQALIQRRYQEMWDRKKVYEGKKLYYKGKYRSIKVFRPLDEQEQVKLKGDTLIVVTNQDPIDALKNWMTQRTKDFIRRNLAKYAKKFGTAEPRVVEVKETKRWGYCTQDGKLVFSWQLMALPKKLREYVLFHEIAHLLEFSHSKDFHKKLASVCPDFKERERAIKNIVPYVNHKKAKRLKKKEPC
jgi:hypothetical protein